MDKPPSFRGPAVLALTASTSERFPGGAKPIVEHPNGDVPASGKSRRSDGSCSACASLEGRASMDRRIAAEAGDAPASDQGEPEAIDFVRFCYRRRSVGWPELYDEMCAVAGRGLYRGYSADDLSGIGVGLDTVRDAGARRDRPPGRRRGPGASAPERRRDPGGPRRADRGGGRDGRARGRARDGVGRAWPRPGPRRADRPTPESPTAVRSPRRDSCLSPPAPEPVDGRHRRPGCPHSSRRLLRQNGGPSPVRARVLSVRVCDERLSRLDDAGLRCRLRSALTHLRVRSLAVLAGALPASPSRDERSGVSSDLRPRRLDGARVSSGQARMRRLAISPSIWRSAST